MCEKTWNHPHVLLLKMKGPEIAIEGAKTCARRCAQDLASRMVSIFMYFAVDHKKTRLCELKTGVKLVPI